MDKLKIAILGTRGIPNIYGGFEQFAEIISQGLVVKGCDVTVYCTTSHVYKDSTYNGVKLIHKNDSENIFGTAGQFIYDLTCIYDVRKRNFDIIYLLGYTSSSIWQRLIFKRGALVVTNMDGLEWKRSKYSKPVQRFLQSAEKLAVKYSNYLIADSIGIQNYLNFKYKVNSIYFPYGSYVFENPDESSLTHYNLKKYEYDILIARFEPENNIEMILEAFHQSKVKRELILVGNYLHTVFGKKMRELYAEDKRIKFLGAIYNQSDLNNLRFFSNLYFHGHSVGGTNPSLLEAMGSSALICYHNNEFNGAIVENDGFAFDSVIKLRGIIETEFKVNNNLYIENNLRKISAIYRWDLIINQYYNFFCEIKNNK